MAKVDTKLVSQAAYARHRGCSREAVRQAVLAGRIRTFGPGKLVDPVLADHEWRVNTRARAGGKPEAELPPEAQADYSHWRCRREAADAQIAERHLAELAGTLIRRDAIVAAEARKAGAVRESLLSVPHRLSALLVGRSQPEVFAVLQDEMLLVLAHLSAPTPKAN